MAFPLTFSTPVNLSFWDGGEHEYVLHLRYNFTRGYADTYDEPGCADSVEIISIRLLSQDGNKEYDVPRWMQSVIDDDESLAASLIADAREKNAFAAEEAAERRAEEFRNELAMERR
ncbi:hypothetical protein [Methylobacterium komagatae]